MGTRRRQFAHEHSHVFLSPSRRSASVAHESYVSSALPRECFRPVHPAFLSLSRRIASVSHGCVVLPRSRRTASVAHGCVVLPRSRRTASAAYARTFLPRLRRAVSVTHGCTFLPRLRRVASVAHGRTFLPHSRRNASVSCTLRFFRFPEGSLPSRTASLPFCQRLRKALSVCREEVCLTRYAVYLFSRNRPKPISVPSVVQRAQLSLVQNLTPGRVHSGFQRDAHSLYLSRLPKRSFLLHRATFHFSPVTCLGFPNLAIRLPLTSRGTASGTIQLQSDTLEKYLAFIAGRSG
jgi:hypothetical protein